MGVGAVQPTSLVQHSRIISRQKHQLDEIISLKEQVSEIAHLKSEFLALKTELAEVKEQNKRYEKKLSELITYSIFHTKNTKAQEEICFIVRSMDPDGPQTIQKEIIPMLLQANFPSLLLKQSVGSHHDQAVNELG